MSHKDTRREREGERERGRERERERERRRERGRERPRGYSNNRRLQSLRPKNKQMAWSTLSSLVTGWSTVIKSHGDKRKKRK